MTHQPRLLHVDSYEGARTLLRIIFEHKYKTVEIIEAGDVETAWEIIERENGKIDMILTDVVMPGKRGYELLEMITSHPTYQHIPVVFLSARGDVESVMQAMDNGAVDYFPKPFMNDTVDRLYELMQTHSPFMMSDDAGHASEDE